MDSLSTGSPDDPAEGPSPRPWVPLGWLVALAVGLGITLRLVLHFSGRALWRDEAMIALNIVQRDAAGLLEPLDWDQGAPVLWLLLMRAVVVLLGHDELILRLPALLAGLLALPMTFRAAWTYLGRLEALFAVLVLGLMPLHIYQSSELKPYSLDALATSVLMLAFATTMSRLRALDGHDDVDEDDDDDAPRDLCLPRGDLAGLAVLGVVMVWVSMPAAFVLAGGGTALLLGEARWSRWRSFRSLCAVSSVWAVGFFAHLLVQRTLLTNDTLAEYWQESAAFAPFPPRSFEDVRVLIELTVGLFVDPARSPLVDALNVGPRTGLVMAVAAVIGMGAMARHDRRLACLVALPVVFGFAASALEAFPLQGRLLMFWTPLLALMVAAGLAEAFRRARPGGRLLGWALLGGVTFGPLLGAADLVANGAEREELRDMLEVVAASAQPGDTLWVYYGARPAYLFYAEATDGFDASALQVVQGPDRLDELDDYEPALQALVGRGRVWTLFSHSHMTDGGDERRYHLRELDERGERLEEAWAAGASVHLWQL